MRPLLLGHRGARATRHVPENTLASFELCLEHGCDGFEFDIRRSSDGVREDAPDRVRQVCRSPNAEKDAAKASQKCSTSWG